MFYQMFLGRPVEQGPPTVSKHCDRSTVQSKKLQPENSKVALLPCDVNQRTVLNKSQCP